MSTDRLIALIEGNPGIRTIQIVDRLDVDIFEVEEALQVALKAGSIEEHDVTAPNGRAAKAFTLQGVALPDASAAAAGQAKPKSKVDKAIDFITSQPDRQATSAQLHLVMGLKSTETASQFLRSALDNSRLARDGKIWRLGSGMPKVFPPTPGKTESSPAPVQMQKKQEVTAEIPVSSTTQQQGSPAPAAPSPESAFRCALWSDGSRLVLERDGQAFAELSGNETAHLRDFLGRAAA